MPSRPASSACRSTQRRWQLSASSSTPFSSNWRARYALTRLCRLFTFPQADAIAQLKRQGDDEVRTVRVDFQKALATSAETQAVQQRRIQDLEAKLVAQTQQLEQLTVRHHQEISTIELSHQKELIGIVRHCAGPPLTTCSQRRETEEKLARGYESRGGHESRGGYESAREKIARSAPPAAAASTPAPAPAPTPSTPAAAARIESASQRSTPAPRVAVSQPPVAAKPASQLSDVEDVNDDDKEDEPEPPKKAAPNSFYSAKSVVHSVRPCWLSLVRSSDSAVSSTRRTARTTRSPLYAAHRTTRRRHTLT